MARDFTLNAVVPPQNVPMLKPDGSVTEEWRLFFEALATALFGPTGEDDVTQTLSGAGVQLGSGTTGPYVATISQGTGVNVTGGQGEGSNAIVSIPQAIGPADNPAFNNRTIGTDQAALDQAIADLANKVNRVTISLAETNHATPVDFAAVKTALDALGAKVNETIGALS